jgi:hypothetical protein
LCLVNNQSLFPFEEKKARDRRLLSSLNGEKEGAAKGFRRNRDAPGRRRRNKKEGAAPSFSCFTFVRYSFLLSAYAELVPKSSDSD